jgi:7-cyano-7-deazaguanine synthase
MGLHAVNSTVGVMLSGGLDSSILLAHLAREGRRIQPFYIQSHLVWQSAELQAVRRLLRAISRSFRQIDRLVVLRLPLADLYENHWSMTGCLTPDAQTSDDAVYLPGRNALLLVKPALWCQLHGIRHLALGVLAANPFADARPGFFESFQAAVNDGARPELCVLRPFAGLTKREVMELGRGLPLHLTFSCIAPVAGLHCGRCNKCGERRAAFRLADAPDPTAYAATPDREKVSGTLSGQASPDAARFSAGEGS